MLRMYFRCSAKIEDSVTHKGKRQRLRLQSVAPGHGKGQRPQPRSQFYSFLQQPLPQMNYQNHSSVDNINCLSEEQLNAE